MAQVIAQTRTMSGIRRTSTSDTVNCIVEAFHNISEGEVGRVDFAITVNGTPHSTISVTTRADWTPNDTDETDPLAGIVAGCAPIAMSFGTTISMSDFSPGTIVVTPTAYPGTAGTSRTCDSITIYNDKDGTDRRPSNKIIYVSPSGDNNNTGLTSTIGSSNGPVKTIQAAISKCKNSAGIGGHDVGGATIYLLEGLHLWGNDSSIYSDTQWYTSGQHWLTITKAPSLRRDQVTIRMPLIAFDGYSRYLYASFVSSNLLARLRLKSVEITGKNLIFSGSGVFKQIWLDNVLTYNVFLGREIQDAHCKQAIGTPSGAIVEFDPELGQSSGTGITILDNLRYATGSEVRNGYSSFSDYRLTRGCTGKDCAHIAIHIMRDHNGASTCQFERVSGRNSLGFFENLSGPFTYTKTGNTIRLTDTILGRSWGQQARHLIGGYNVGIFLENWATNGSSNGNGGKYVTDAGYVNGYSFVEFIDSTMGTSATAQGTISTAVHGQYSGFFETPLGTASQGSMFKYDPHGDYHQVLGLNFGATPVVNWMFTNIRGVDAKDNQGFSSGSQSNGFAIVNFYDGYLNNGNLLNSYIGGNWGQGIMRHITIGGNYLHLGTPGQGSELIDCVFESTSLNQNSGNLSRVSHNHFINASHATGTNTSTGMWWLKVVHGKDSTPTIFSSGKGTASTLWNRGSIFFENNRGALRNVATGNWGLNTAPVSLGQIRTINKTNQDRFDVITCGVPFPKGTVFSEGDRISVDIPNIGPILTQWYPIGNRYSDGSIKYGKVSYRTLIAAGSVQDVSLTLRGNYIALAATPGISNTQRDSTTALLRLNNQISLTNPVTGTVYPNGIPLGAATLIEGGGPEDHYARYKWFGRYTNIPNIWVEFTYDILLGAGFDQIKFWLRFGNSLIERGWSSNTGPNASTYNFSLSSSVDLDILPPSGGTSSLVMEAYDTVAIANISGGRRYRLIEPGFPSQSGFRAGLARCVKGTINYSNSTTAVADITSPTMSMSLQWDGNAPPWFENNPRPAYITNEGVGYSLIENGHIPGQLPPPAEPATRSVFSLKPATSGPGGQGWGGSAFWQNPLYHIVKSKWPAELILVDRSLRNTCFRNAWWVESNGTSLLRANYPNTFFYYTSLFFGGSSAYDFLGYGQANYGPGMLINEYQNGSGENYEGPDPQHCQMTSDWMGALMTCDYHGLEAARVWSEIWSINIATDTPNTFINGVDAARANGRGLMTAIMLYEITGSPTLKQAIYNRFLRVYNLMNGNMLPPIYNTNSFDRYGCPIRALDRIRFIQLEQGNQVGNLVNSVQLNRSHAYTWQEAIAAGAYYQLYSILSRENPNDSVALKARELAYDISATVVNVSPKFGVGTPNNWEYISINIPGIRTLASSGNVSAVTALCQQFNLGTDVVGQTSGTTGTIFFQIVGEEMIGGDAVTMYIKNVSGPGFVVGESLLNTTSGQTRSISLVYRGYAGVVAYRVDHTIGAPYTNMTESIFNQRQTPWTRTQLETFDTNAIGFGQYLGSSPYALYYIPYLQWQLQCAAIAKEGCLNGFYSDSPGVTVAQLLAKCNDMINSVYPFENNNQQILNGRAVWPVNYWPFMTVRPGVFQGLTSSTTDYTANPVVQVLVPSIRPLNVSIVNPISVSKSIGVQTISASIQQLSVATTSSGANVLVRPQILQITPYVESSITQFVGIGKVVTTIVINNAISAGVTTTSSPTVLQASVISSSEPEGPVIVHVILSMLLDGPSGETSGAPAEIILDSLDSDGDLIDLDFSIIKGQEVEDSQRLIELAHNT